MTVEELIQSKEFDRLFKSCRYVRLFNEDTQEELRQEVIYQIWRTRDKIPEISLSTYVWNQVKWSLKRLKLNKASHLEQDLPFRENPFLDIADEVRGVLSSPCINKDESDVLRMRFLERKTLADAGKELGVTRQRIEQIEKSAIKKLRRHYEVSK